MTSHWYVHGAAPADHVEWNMVRSRETDMSIVAWVEQRMGNTGTLHPFI